MLKVRAAVAADQPAWDRFVLACPDATFFHRFGWSEAIARTFGHPTLYRVAEQDGDIVGVLPLAQVRTKLFGNTLISVPFCVYGGPLTASVEARAALDAEAAALRAALGASAVEYRFRDVAHTPPEWLGRPGLYATFRRAITADDDANLKLIPRKQRAVVRKAIANELTASASQDANALFPLYAESVRNLGTPVFPKKWFSVLLSVFGHDAEVMAVRDGDTPIAACLSFYFRDEILPYYAGGNAAARTRGGYDYVYWEITRRAAARGARLFDFGRSKEGTGPYAFKKNWGFEPAPLHYRFNLAPGATIPETNPNNPKYRAMIAAWKRLPLPVANLLGPMIVRGVG